MISFLRGHSSYYIIVKYCGTTFIVIIVIASCKQGSNEGGINNPK